MNAVCFNDKYDTKKAIDGINEYDETYKKYLAERSINSRDGNWTKSICQAYSKYVVKEDYELLRQQGFINIDNK